MQITGRILHASRDERTITGLLLPYGEVGSTSLGKITAAAGALTVADPDAVVLNIEHDATRPIGRGTAVDDTDAGLTATFRIARTRAGDDILEEAAEGLRSALSVEIADPIIRAGALLGGTLTGAAVVVAPAFPSARLVAADAGDIPETTTPEAEDPMGEEPDTEEETNVAETTATVQLGTLAAGTTKTEIGKGALFAMLAANGNEPRKLLAALSDVIPSNAIGIEQPQYVGELWSGKLYQRKFIPLFGHEDLTSYTVRGWRWVTKPAVAAYAGGKVAIPSGAILTEQSDIPAERIAGGHDIDRKFRDFNDTEFWSAYFAAMTESYARVSDTAVLADAITAAGAAITVGAVPAGVPLAMTMIVDGALEVLNNVDTMPTFAIVASGLWRDLVLTREEDRLAYLDAALGLNEGTLTPQRFQVIPSAAVSAGQVLVGVRDAVTVHELGGPAPIRVEALNVANGGIDVGVFGYYAVNVHDADGLVLVDDGIA